jgi:hypothetical protein
MREIKVCTCLMYICMYLCVCLYVRACVFVCVRVCVYVCLYVCIRHTIWCEFSAPRHKIKGV